eukprot:6475318-Amphidinium_carterae.1
MALSRNAAWSESRPEELLQKNARAVHHRRVACSTSSLLHETSVPSQHADPTSGLMTLHQVVTIPGLFVLLHHLQLNTICTAICTAHIFRKTSEKSNPSFRPRNRATCWAKLRETFALNRRGLKTKHERQLEYLWLHDWVARGRERTELYEV